jgi:hypothetical protein
MNRYRAARTPIGLYGGAPAGVRPNDLAALAEKGLDLTRARTAWACRTPPVGSRLCRRSTRWRPQASALDQGTTRWTGWPWRLTIHVVVSFPLLTVYLTFHHPAAGSPRGVRPVLP